MDHPPFKWTKERLEWYLGTGESLKVEFKSYRSLDLTKKQERDKKIVDASRDIAGMANEQGGEIIYFATSAS